MAYETRPESKILSGGLLNSGGPTTLVRKMPSYSQMAAKQKTEELRGAGQKTRSRQAPGMEDDTLGKEQRYGMEKLWEWQKLWNMDLEAKEC